MTKNVSLTLGWLLLSLAPCAFSQQAGQDPGSLTAFQAALQQDGFDIHPGYAFHPDVGAAYCNDLRMPDAAYFNTAAPYLALQVWNSPLEAPQPPLPTVFQLRPDEAIVLIGLTPPPVKYFSYQPYLYNKVYPWGTVKVFTSLVDSVNIATIHTTGPTPFNTAVVLIFTPDHNTDARVRAALKSAGYPAGIINTMVFPASMLNLGLGADADQFGIVLRTAMWQDSKAGQEYLAHPPLNVFRVTPRVMATGNPFPAPKLRVRGTGQTEMDLMNKLGELRRGIVAANPGLYTTEYETRPFLYEGYDYLQRADDAYGDIRDTLYLAAGYIPELGMTKPMTLADNEFLIVYGANHVATGKVTYMNINGYATETAKYGLGTAFYDQFPGTAQPYLPAGDPAADLMYVYKVSRHCGASESHCLQLSDNSCARLTLDSNTQLGIITRSYLEPATKVGPAFTEILYDRVIKFSPRQ